MVFPFEDLTSSVSLISFVTFYPQGASHLFCTATKKERSNQKEKNASDLDFSMSEKCVLVYIFTC